MKELTNQEKIHVYFQSLEKENLALRQELVRDLVEFKMYTEEEIEDESFQKLAQYHFTFYRLLEQCKKTFENTKEPDILRMLEICGDFLQMNQKIGEYQSQLLLEEAFRQFEYMIELPIISGLLPEECADILDLIHNYQQQDNHQTSKRQEQEIEKQIQKIRKENYFE